MKTKILSIALLSFLVGFSPSIQTARAQETSSAPETIYDFYQSGYVSVVNRPESPMDAAAISYSIATHMLRLGNVNAALYFLGRAHAFVAMI